MLLAYKSRYSLDMGRGEGSTNKDLGILGETKPEISPSLIPSDMGTPRIPLIYSRRVRRALQIAERAHRGTNRKAGDSPYVLHVVAVSQLLAAARADDDLLCAAYLHDAVEDTGVTLLEIEDEFGHRVARLVAGVTKPSVNEEGRRLTSDEKSALTEQAMSVAEIDIVALKSADLIANLSDLIIDKQIYGDDHWDEIFGKKAEAKLAHYARLAQILIDRLTDEHAYPLLAATLRERLTQFKQLHTAWQAEKAAASETN
jgi:guanosine-3',5'-bis(diphosphate) 3'-pyrophosphohydrolase